MGFLPGDLSAVAGLGRRLSGIFLAAAGHVAVLEGSCWSARSRAAVRTNELDADERRLIIGSGEGSFRAGGEGSCYPRCGWRSGLASTHRARPVAGSCRMGERARGLVTLPVCGCVVAALAALPVAAVPGACAAWAAAS